MFDFTSPIRLKSLFSIFSLIFLMVILPGCSTIHMYQIGGTQGREGGNQPGTEWTSETRHNLLWGAIRQDLPVDNCALGDGTRINIEEVKIEKRFPHILASIVTIGLWEPVKISWRCAKPKPVTDTLN